MILMMLFKIVIRFGTLIRRSKSRAQNLKKCLPKRSQRQLVAIDRSNETEATLARTIRYPVETVYHFTEKIKNLYFKSLP